MAAKTVQDDTKIVPFSKCLRNEVGLLRLAGFYTMKSVFPGERKRPANNWEDVLFVLGISQVLFAARCAFYTFIRDDTDHAIEALTPLVTTILMLVKGAILWYCRRELFEILRTLGVMWEVSHANTKIRNEILQSAEKGRLVFRYYGSAVMVSTINYTLVPYANVFQQYLYKNATSEYDYSVTIFPATYPFAVDTMTKFLIVLTWEEFTMVFIMTYWIGSLSLFAQITTHTSIQFEILCHDLMNLAASDDATEVKNENELIRQLNTIPRRHQELYRCCQKISYIFDSITFVTMLLTACNLCLCAYRFDKELSRGNWSNAMKYLFHAVNLLAQAMIYCGYADALTQQSGILARGTYDCQWTERSKQFKIVLLIIMMRSQKEYKFTALGIFDVNLMQITAIVNTAGSYYALLKTVA